MEKIVVFLETTDKDALIRLAQKEYRDPRYQASVLIREGLERRKEISLSDQPCSDQVKADAAR